MVYFGWMLKVFLYVYLAFKGVEADECINYVNLEEVYLRSPANTYVSTGHPPLSDNADFIEQWYRAGYADMPIVRPDANSCGTVYPFYMKSEEKYPEVGVTERKEACLGDNVHPCHFHKDIEVRNCGNYRVYKLVPIGFNSAAYCFEFNRTGQVPSYVPSTAQVEFQNISWESLNGTEYPRLVFSCSFPLSDDTDLWYGVTWWVNTEKIKEAVVKSSNLTAANLIETDFTDLGYRHGISIFCDVHARFSFDGVAGNTTASQAFFAGIKVYNQSVRLDEGGTTYIMFEPTVPFACVRGVTDCHLNIQMIDPLSDGQCGSTILSKSERCTFSIQGINDYHIQSWRLSYSMEIVHTQSTDYDQTDYYTVPLTTNNVTHTFWSDTRLSDITVNIESDSSIWRGKYCYLHGDPRMKTFDGWTFQQQDPGDYILYSNDDANQQVQYKNHACRSDNDSPYCVCSVLVRAWRDVFIMDICDGNTIIDFLLCDDQTLKVESDRDSDYTVTFPSGTEVHILMSEWPRYSRQRHLNINIYPAAKDTGKIRGLCGVLDGENESSFMLPNGTYTNSSIVFAEGWKVDQADNLLLPINGSAYEALQGSRAQSQLCHCPLASINGNPSAPGNEPMTRCSMDSYSNCKQKKGNTDFKCNRSQLDRRKRDISSLYQNAQLITSKKRSVLNVMLEVDARYHCESVFNASASYSVCMSVVQEMDDSYLNDCVLDLQMTGNKSLANEHLILFNDACLTFASKNVTLQQEDATSVYLIYITTCPSNCSNNGVCSEGVCTCDSDFAGSDCSKDISLPPTITNLLNNGLCDVSEGSCDKLSVYGDDFYLTNSTKCQFLTQHVLTDNTTEDRGITVNDGVQRSLFEAECNPPTENNPAANVFVKIYNISVSNNGSQYSNSLTLYIYDSTCQELKTESGVMSFSLKDGFCFINGKCVIDGTQLSQTSDICLICNRIKSLFDWSNATECAWPTSIASSTIIPPTIMPPFP